MELNLNIRDRCHVNSNEDGDRFVGVKADTENAMVYFPIGYQLPDDDDQLRVDIRNLFYVLSEFLKEDRVIETPKFEAPQTVDFPIHAYLNVINYFLRTGRYYVETDPIYKTDTKGNTSWPRTILKQTPLIQKNGSLIFTQFSVRSVTPNSNKLITQIHRYCVYEAFDKLGWLYVPLKPESPGPHPDNKTSIAILSDKLCNTNDDNDKILFGAMKRMLEFIDEKNPEKQFYFGTDCFENVWERLINRVFGIENKADYFPRTRWLLDYGAEKVKSPLIPDTIMIYNGKYYVLDAKCYRYGWTANSEHLPNGTDINKQITYGEYIERTRSVPNEKLFNAFVMPYNMTNNLFGLTSQYGNIGEAVGDWRLNSKNYERIQGVVVDTRYLMYNYTGSPEQQKKDMAECIEKVLSRGAIPVQVT